MRREKVCRKVCPVMPRRSSPSQRRLPTGFDVEEAVAGDRIVKDVRLMFGRHLGFEYGKRHIIERQFQFAATFFP